MTGTYLNTFLQLGALYAFVAFSVAVSFRFLSFPDLTVAGSFLLGAATSAQFIVHDIHWGIAMVAASVAGFLAGLTTATIHRLLGINKFFSGILAMMMLYSVNLRVLGGANLSIFEEATLFSALSGPDYVTTLFCLGLAFGGAIICLASFHTWFGLLLRGLGTNAAALRMSWFKEWGLMIAGIGFANALTALGGSLVTQYQQFADASMGLHVVVRGFAALFLGEALVVGIGTVVQWWKESEIVNGDEEVSSIWEVRGEIVAGLSGSILLTAVTTGTLYFGLPPSDLRFVTAVILIAGMVFRQSQSSYLLVPVSRFEQ